MNEYQNQSTKLQIIKIQNEIRPVRESSDEFVKLVLSKMKIESDQSRSNGRRSSNSRR